MSNPRYIPSNFRLLKVIFIILLLVIFGELAYYVYIEFSSEKNISHTTLTRGVEVPTIMPLDQPLETNLSKKDIEIGNILLQNVKKTLDLHKNKVLIKSQKTDIFESNIKRIELASGFKNTFKYDALIALEYKPEEDYTIYLNKNDLDKTRVFIVDNDKLLPYNFSSLKNGDRVRIELITNMLEYFDKNTEEIIITKIK